MANEIDVHVQRNDNSVAVWSDKFEIDIELGVNSKDISQSDDFAVWLALPFAMREGRPMKVTGQVSPTTVRNARQISEYWAFWVPELFAPISVEAPDQRSSQAAPPDSPSIMCFSGGMDSTFALVRHVQTTGQKPVLLTVHGLDYRSEEKDRFAKLLKKTEPTRSEFGLETLSVNSNARTEAAKFDVPADISFSFNLFACLFLYQHRYSSGLIAANNPIHYEWARMPYGSNSISNPLFANDSFGIHTLGLDAARSQKAGYLSQFPKALSSLSFCGERNFRPNNCGTCQECWRAKAVFYAETGDVPKIFLDQTFDPKDLSPLNQKKSNFHVVAVDILASAQRNGRTEEYPKLLELIRKRRQEARDRNRIGKFTSRVVRKSKRVIGIRSK